MMQQIPPMGKGPGPDGPGGIYAGSMPLPGGSQNHYAALNRYARKGQIVLVGSSLMGQFPINELMMSQGLPGIVYNRAVGCNTAEYLASPALMEHSIFDLEPTKLFLNIGTRDMDLPGDTIGNLIRNYCKILSLVQERLPDCQIHIIAFYPTLKPKADENRPAHFRSRESLIEANHALQALASEMHCRFVDMNACITDADGYLRAEFAADAIHLTPAGYYALLQELVKYF
jgi:lysophospholipase L1-like esterase